MLPTQTGKHYRLNFYPGPGSEGTEFSCYLTASGSDVVGAFNPTDTVTYSSGNGYSSCGAPAAGALSKSFAAGNLSGTIQDSSAEAIAGAIVVAVGSLLETGRIRRFSVTAELHRIADEQPAVLRARDRALYEQKTAFSVGTDDFEVLLGALTITHVTSHLLVLENATWILTVTRRTMRTVRDRNTVCCTKTTKAPTLHGAGKAFTLRVTGDVDLLTSNEVIGAD